MTKEWKPINTLQELAAAMDAGEEIETGVSDKNFAPWRGNEWISAWKYRSRPRPVKRTVWVNLYPGPRQYAYHYNTQQEADSDWDSGRIGGKAWPLDIEE